jgi:hypothetical protein
MRSTGCKLGLAVAFAAFAVGVNAQPATGTTHDKSGTSAAASANTAKAHSTMKKSSTAAKSHMASRGTATHRAAARHERSTHAMASNGADSSYRAALRRCVTGPEPQRDSCLDQAIAQYGHA